MDIESIAREVLEPLGYEVLEVISNVGRGSTTLTIRIDRLDEKPVAVEDLDAPFNAAILGPGT